MLLGFFRSTQIYKRPQTHHFQRIPYISILPLPTTSITITKNPFHKNFNRSYSSTTTPITTLTTKNLFHQSFRRNYSSYGGDSHHHHPVEEIKEVPEYSPEYIEKYFGHLVKAESKPDDFWPLSVLSSPAALECIAEINGTEFKFPKLDGNVLKQKYKEQLASFENIGKANLEKEGVSSLTISQIHKLYQLRAAVPLFELKQAISDLGFLRKHPTYRVTHSGLSELPQWKQSRAQFYLNSLFFNPNFDPSKTSVGHSASNEEEAAANVRHFKGVRGLLLALEKGLTPVQRDHLHAILGSSNVSGLELQNVSRLAHDIKEASVDDGHHHVAELTRLHIEASSDYPPGTPGYDKLQEMLPEKEKSTAVSVHTTRNPTEFRESFVKELLSISKELKPEKKPNIEKLTQAIEHVTQPEIQDDLQLLHLITNRDLSPHQQTQLLELFIGDDAGISDAVLMDALNPHPLAVRIIGERSDHIAEEEVHYTRTFKEGAETPFVDVAQDPRAQKLMDNPPDGIVSPTPIHPPFNNALEEIYHMKLEALAQMLNFDIHNDLGLSKFDLFCQSFDISPGEATLDRCHMHPPPAHTYEELPILKFDGYNPFLDETPKETSVT